MNHTAIVINRAKKYEKLLTERLGASGSGLNELKQSVQDKLPRQLAGDLAALAFTRNQFAHDTDVDRIKDEEYFVELINRIEDEFSNVLPDYNSEPIHKDDLRPSSPKETFVRVPGPSVKETVTIHNVPPLIVLGVILIGISLLLAFFNGGFTEASTYTIQEPVHRWWWWDGKRDVVMAESHWKLSMYLLFAGSISCALGTAFYFLAKSK